MIDRSIQLTKASIADIDTYITGVERIETAVQTAHDVIFTQFSISVVNGRRLPKTFAVTLAINVPNRLVLALDVREGDRMLFGQMNCLRRTMLEYAFGAPLLTKGQKMSPLHVYCDMKPDLYFQKIVADHGGSLSDIADCAIQLVGCTERYRFHAQQAIANLAELPEEMLEERLLAELRAFWYPRWGFSKLPDYFLGHSMITRASAPKSAQEMKLFRQILQIGHPLFRRIRPGMPVRVLGKNYTNDAFEAGTMERGKPYVDKVFINPWNERSVFMLAENGKALVELDESQKAVISATRIEGLNNNIERREAKPIFRKLPVPFNGRQRRLSKPGLLAEHHAERQPKAANSI